MAMLSLGTRDCGVGTGEHFRSRARPDVREDVSVTSWYEDSMRGIRRKFLVAESQFGNLSPDER